MHTLYMQTITLSKTKLTIDRNEYLLIVKTRRKQNTKCQRFTNTVKLYRTFLAYRTESNWIKHDIFQYFDVFSCSIRSNRTLFYCIWMISDAISLCYISYSLKPIRQIICIIYQLFDWFSGKIYIRWCMSRRIKLQ